MSYLIAAGVPMTLAVWTCSGGDVRRVEVVGQVVVI